MDQTASSLIGHTSDTRPPVTQSTHSPAGPLARRRGRQRAAVASALSADLIIHSGPRPSGARPRHSVSDRSVCPPRLCGGHLQVICPEGHSCEMSSWISDGPIGEQGLRHGQPKRPRWTRWHPQGFRFGSPRRAAPHLPHSQWLSCSRSSHLLSGCHSAPRG